MIVGLTGGIGAGKTTVSSMFAARGAIIVDTDLIARELVEPPSKILDEIRAEFGSDITQADGRLNRQKLALVVFEDASKRDRLNAIMHPPILRRVAASVDQHPASAIVLVVAPLLFESNYHLNCDVVIAVVAPLGIRTLRVMQRDNLSPLALSERARAQLPDAEYERRADIIIHNDGDRQGLEQEVDAAWSSLVQRARRSQRERMCDE